MNSLFLFKKTVFITDSLCAKKTLSHLQNFIPNVRLIEEVGNQLTYILPHEDGHQADFAALFRSLEENKHYLNIDKYGICDTSLEEVFLKVTHQADLGEDFEPEKLRELTVADWKALSNEDDERKGIRWEIVAEKCN